MQVFSVFKSVRALNHIIQLKTTEKCPFLYILMKDFFKNATTLLLELIRAQQILYNLVKMKSLSTSAVYNKLKSGTAPFFQ